MKNPLLKVKVNKETGCWEWQGATNNSGYGYAQLDGRVQGVHRWLYCTLTGLQPPVVMHKCNNKLCLNINHLQGGTHRENIRQAFEDGLFPDSRLPSKTHNRRRLLILKALNKGEKND